MRRVLVLLTAACLVGCQRGLPQHDGASFAVAADGKSIAWTTGPGAGNELMWRGADGVQRTLATGAYFEGPTISPDLKTVLVATGRNFRARLSIVSVDVASGRTASLIPQEQVSQAAPTYSPDGKRVAFRQGTKPKSQSMGGVEWRDFDLWVCAADGSDSHRLTEGAFLRMSTPRWSPDGKRIAFSMIDDEGVSWLWVVDSTNGNRLSELRLENNESMPVYLGERIVIVSDRQTFGKYRIGYVDPVSGDFEPIVREEGYFLEPHVAGGRLFVLEDAVHRKRFRVSEVGVRTGQLAQVLPESAFDPEPPKP